MKEASKARKVRHVEHEKKFFPLYVDFSLCWAPICFIGEKPWLFTFQTSLKQDTSPPLWLVMANQMHDLNFFINHFASHCFLKTKCSKYFSPCANLKYLVMKKRNWYFLIVTLSVLVQSSRIKWITPPNPIIKTLEKHIKYRMTRLFSNFFIHELKEQNVIINTS